jgi:putative endonuclease
MTKNQNLGKEGESIAIDFLIKNKYTIIEKNWTFGHLEIDIIAQNGSTIVFCEVKTRTNSHISSPVEAVNKMKQKNIIRAANAFISYKKIQLEARFDIITIVGTAETHQLEHIPGAYSPTW